MYNRAMTHGYRAIALFALFSMCGSAESTVPERLEKLQQGRRMTVLLNTGDTLVGGLGPLQKEAFLLVSEQRGHADRLVRFDEIKSVKTKMATSTKWAVGIAVWLPFLIGSLILGK